MKTSFFLMTLAVAGLACAQTQDSQQQPRPRFNRGDAPPGGGGFGGPNSESRITKHLGLTAEQQNKMHTAFAEHQVTVKGIGDQMRTAHDTLTAAIKSGNEGQIESASQTIAQLQHTETSAHAKAIAKIYATLTPEQKVKAGDKLEGLMGGGPGRGPGGPGGPGGGPRPARAPAAVQQ